VPNRPLDGVEQVLPGEQSERGLRHVVRIIVCPNFSVLLGRVHLWSMTATHTDDSMPNFNGRDGVGAVDWLLADLKAQSPTALWTFPKRVDDSQTDHPPEKPVAYVSLQTPPATFETHRPNAKAQLPALKRADCTKYTRCGRETPKRPLDGHSTAALIRPHAHCGHRARRIAVRSTR